MLKITPAGGKIFMLRYVTNSGVRRKPALGRFGELAVDQARKLAQDWLAEVRHNRDPCAGVFSNATLVTAVEEALRLHRER